MIIIARPATGFNLKKLYCQMFERSGKFELVTCNSHVVVVVVASVLPFRPLGTRQCTDISTDGRNNAYVGEGFYPFCLCNHHHFKSTYSPPNNLLAARLFQIVENFNKIQIK